MSDTRESFEKLALENEDDITLLVNDKTGEKTYADTHTELAWLWFADGAQSQQDKIDELTEIIEIDQRQVIDNMTKAITSLEARCKMLSDGISKVIEFIDKLPVPTKGATAITIQLQGLLATLDPTQSLDRFENQVIDKCLCVLQRCIDENNMYFIDEIRALKKEVK